LRSDSNWFGWDKINQDTRTVTDIKTDVDPGTGDNTEPKEEELGRWFGHAIDISPAVTANIWRTMGKFFTDLLSMY